MKLLDPLVYHLHRQGTGSWSQFSRAVEAFDETLDGWSCARALAEHATVEFDFDNDRSWSVTSVQLVNMERHGTVAWGGTSRALSSYDIDVETGVRLAWIDGVAFGYTHGVRVRRRGGQWPRNLIPIGISSIMDHIPAFSTIVAARPAAVIPIRKAERLEVKAVERRNPGGFRFHELRSTWEPSDGVSVYQDAAWKLDRSTHLVSRNHRVFWVQGDIALWWGFLTAAERLGIEHLVRYDQEAATLLIAVYPKLPVAYVRALLLCGARESQPARRDIRVFKNVLPATASWLASKLGVSRLA